MLVHHGSRRGIYVTTTWYTRSATALAEARDILTIDEAELVALFTAAVGHLRYFAVVMVGIAIAALFVKINET